MPEPWDIYFKDVPEISNVSEYNTSGSCWIEINDAVDESYDVESIENATDIATLRRVRLIIVLVVSILCSVLVFLLIICSGISNETCVKILFKRKINTPKKGIEGQFQFLMSPQPKNNYNGVPHGCVGVGNSENVGRKASRAPGADTYVIVEVEDDSQIEVGGAYSDHVSRTTTNDDVMSYSSPEMSLTSPEVHEDLSKSEIGSVPSLSSLLEKFDTKCEFENLYLSRETEC